MHGLSIRRCLLCVVLALSSLAIVAPPAQAASWGYTSKSCVVDDAQLVVTHWRSYDSAGRVIYTFHWHQYGTTRTVRVPPVNVNGYRKYPVEGYASLYGPAAYFGGYWVDSDSQSRLCVVTYR